MVRRRRCPWPISRVHVWSFGGRCPGQGALFPGDRQLFHSSLRVTVRMLMFFSTCNWNDYYFWIIQWTEKHLFHNHWEKKFSLNGSIKSICILCKVSNHLPSFACMINDMLIITSMLSIVNECCKTFLQSLPFYFTAGYLHKNHLLKFKIQITFNNFSFFIIFWKNLLG